MLQVKRERRFTTFLSPFRIWIFFLKLFSLRTEGSQLFHFNYGSCSCCLWTQRPIFHIKKKTHTHATTEPMTYTEKHLPERACNQGGKIWKDPGGNPWACLAHFSSHLTSSLPQSPRPAHEPNGAMEHFLLSSCAFLMHTGGNKGSRWFYVVFL